MSSKKFQRLDHACAIPGIATIRSADIEEFPTIGGLGQAELPIQIRKTKEITANTRERALENFCKMEPVLISYTFAGQTAPRLSCLIDGVLHAIRGRKQ